MKVEHSCGGVVFTRKNNTIYYVIIKSIEGYYGFPKGHMEANETEEQTALREIYEETGLKASILPGFKAADEYLLPGKEGVMKRVTYFVAEYQNQEIAYQKEELLGANEMTYDEAIAVFQFENLKKILRKADDFIRLECERKGKAQ